MSKIQLQPVSLARMVRAVEKVRERLLRSTSALDGAKVPYAVIGGNAVAARLASELLDRRVFQLHPHEEASSWQQSGLASFPSR